MSTQWITDRLPTAEDANGGTVLVSYDDGRIYFARFDHVKPDEPWMPLPDPFIKLKRYTVHWNGSLHCWDLMNDNGLCYGKLFLKKEHADIAQRMEYMFNEVMP
jgi:hypothetical protein